MDFLGLHLSYEMMNLMDFKILSIEAESEYMSGIGFKNYTFIVIT